MQGGECTHTTHQQALTRGERHARIARWLVQKKQSNVIASRPVRCMHDCGHRLPSLEVVLGGIRLDVRPKCAHP